MTGPKHLWSGNWQEESSEPAAERVRPVPDAPPPGPDPIPMRRPRRPSTWMLPAGLAVICVAIALAEVLPGSRPSGPGRRGATTPTVSVVPNAQAPNPVIPGPSTTPRAASGNTISGRPVTWLGMQISTENGTAVIQTVQLGSPADAAGLDPGDVIQTVNGRSITAATQIRSAVRGLRPGEGVAISVVRGSAFFSTVADFAGQPITSP
jgi:membrane-associated protease RseP (regulator of RpoE activity)